MSRRHGEAPFGQSASGFTTLLQGCRVRSVYGREPSPELQILKELDRFCEQAVGLVWIISDLSNSRKDLLCLRNGHLFIQLFGEGHRSEGLFSCASWIAGGHKQLGLS